MNIAIMIAVLLDPVALLLIAVGAVIIRRMEGPWWLCIMAGGIIAILMDNVMRALDPFPRPLGLGLLERFVAYSLALLLIHGIVALVRRKPPPVQE